MSTFLGIEIGGTKLQLVAGVAGGRITDRRRLDVDQSRGGAGIREQIAQALPGLIASQQPVAIGVGFGGPVDHETGRIAKSHQIAGWSEFELGEWLREQTGRPVKVDNDANVAALGEALAGAGRGLNPVFYVTLGSGVGGGLVVGGRIFHGAKPGESEIGHVRLDKSGIIIEQRCSGWAVDRRIREAIAHEPESELARLAGKANRRENRLLIHSSSPSAATGAAPVAAESGSEAAKRALPNEEPAVGGEARFLKLALDSGDALAQRILDETAEDLAFALSHIVQLMHPAMIVLGGGLSLVGEPLRAAVQTHLRRYIMEVFGAGPQVQLAALGEDAVPVGALLLASG